MIPTRATYQGTPIIRWTGAFSIFPDIPIPLGIILAAAGCLKPGVFMRRVVEHQVKEDAHIPAVNFLDQLLHIREAAKLRCDGKIIADVQEERF